MYEAVNNWQTVDAPIKNLAAELTVNSLRCLTNVNTPRKKKGTSAVTPQLSPDSSPDVI